jgi:hypothetical protein
MNDNKEQEICEEFNDSEMSYTESEKIEFLKKWENSNLESLLRTWGEKAAGLRWMHLYSASYWRHTDQKLNVVGILLSSIVSASSLIGAFETYLAQSYIMTFVGFIGMLNILNQSMLRYYNCTEKAALHETAGRQFGNFQRYINTKLSLSRMERGPPKLVMEYALREHDRLYKENIEPYEVSFNAFLNHFREKIEINDFSIPDFVSDTLRVHIFDQNPSYNEVKKTRKSTSSLDPGKSMEFHKLKNPMFENTI